MATQMRVVADDTKAQIIAAIGRAVNKETITESFETSIPGVDVEIDADTTTYRNGHTETDCNISVHVSDPERFGIDGENPPKVLAEASSEMDSLAAVLSECVNKNRDHSSEVVFEPIKSNTDTVVFNQTVLFNVSRP